MLSLPRSLATAMALSALTAVPVTANAAVSAYATGNVNMRTCGSTSCPRIATVPVGAPVAVYQCTASYGWCETQYGGYRGWVSGRYLQAVAPGYAAPSPLPAIGALLGIAIIGAAVANNYNYYNHYPYYYPGWRPPRNWKPIYPVRPRNPGVYAPGWQGRPGFGMGGFGGPGGGGAR